MVIVFDLDDTLFDDRTFVLSGFKYVSAYLSSLLNLDQNEIFKALEEELNIQRTQVFDRFLEKKGIFSRTIVSKCLSIYRGHDPEIKLFSDADSCLTRLKGFPLYVVTDGNKIVQKKKFLALGLAKG